MGIFNKLCKEIITEQKKGLNVYVDKTDKGPQLSTKESTGKKKIPLDIKNLKGFIETLDSNTLDVNKCVAANFVARIANSSPTGYGLYVQANDNTKAGIRIANASGGTAIDLFGSGAATFSSTIITGGTTANASAQLQADSTTKGFLPPRMTAAQRTAIGTPAAGLIVYQTDSVEGLYIYSGASWKSLTMV